MTLCAACQPIGNWLLPDLDPSKDSFRYGIYYHYPSWKEITDSAQEGCPFCNQIVHYFNSRGAYFGWYEREIVSRTDDNEAQSWIDKIRNLERASEDTSIMLVKNLTPAGIPTLSIECGGVGSTHEGLFPYIDHGDSASYPITRLREKPHIDADPLSKNSTNQVQSWISDCSSSHEACTQVGSTFVPMRVLDVAKEGEDPKLVETERSSMYSKFVALSHCWGKTQHVLTKIENITQHKAGISFKSLSKTFRDAIILVQRLGLKYIWIDSLCIIQDSDDDWVANAAQMGTIYRHSFLTIAAIDASDGSEGFLSNRQPPVALPYYLVHPEKGEINGSIWMDSWAPDLEDTLSECVISKRAWVAQERFLPSRILHCGKYRYMWECQSMQQVECYPASLQLQSERVQSDWVSAARFAKLSDCSVRSQADLDSLHGVWHMMVSEYSQRSLTMIKDKLPAIAGLAGYFQQATGEGYHAGLFDGDMPHALCWEPVQPWQRPEIYTAPSWSWAAFVTGVVYPLPIKEHVSYVQDFEFALQPLSTKNLLGAVSAGHLSCSVLLRPASLLYVPDGESKLFVGNELLGMTELEVEFKYSLQFWCIFLLSRENYKPARVQQENKSLSRITSVLVLVKAKEHEDTYKRVGIVNRAQYLDDWQQLERQRITIV